MNGIKEPPPSKLYSVVRQVAHGNGGLRGRLQESKRGREVIHPKIPVDHLLTACLAASFLRPSVTESLDALVTEVSCTEATVMPHFRDIRGILGCENGGFR